MSRRKSWLQRAGSVVLFAALVAGTVARPHADGADDLACTPPAASHDESAHYIGSDPSAAPADSGHCFLCHSLRSFHTTLIEINHYYDGPRTERLHTAPRDRAGVVEWTILPGRAPPA